MSTEKILLGALAGFATGALFGVLFAPQKGTDLRRNISRRTQDYANDVKDKFSRFIDSMTDKMETAKDEAGNLVEQGKSTLDHAKNDLKAAPQRSGAGSQTV